MSAPAVPPIHQSRPREPGRTEDRRQFIKKAAAVAIGALVALIPLAAGLVTFLNPLRRKSSQIEFVRITTLDAVPGDGIPRLFQVVKDRTDAWNRYRNEPVGAVYLRNVEGHLSAHNAECPHAGCLVAFLGDAKIFRCPCHDSSFQPDGARIDPLHCPSPRDLDPLPVELKDQHGVQEVWVKFENFVAGTSQRIPRG